METLQAVSNLSELLQAIQALSNPVFVSLCARCGNDNQLMDSSVQNLQELYGKKLGYEKLSGTTAQLLKDELQISKNPVLLLLYNGEIEAVFSGITAQYRLEQALLKVLID